MTELIEQPEVWAIRHKETAILWKSQSGKTSWKKPAHAKGAWAQGKGRNEVPTKVPCHKCCGSGKRLSFSGIERDCYTCMSGGVVRPYFDQQDIYECIRLKTDSDDKLEQVLARVRELEEQVAELKEQIKGLKK